MKLKVHAQRKFAQGAFVPPSASASALERRVDVAAKDENMNIYYNRMSAVSLLDVVAFQNMHTHTEPVVLLERLEERQDPPRQPAAEVNGTHPAPPKNGAVAPVAAAIAPGLPKSKPVRPLRYMRPKRTGVLNQKAQRPQRLHLISLLGSSFKPKPRAVKKKCRKTPSVAVRALRRRRAPSTADSCDLDDDKPLTYIAQVLRRTVALRSDSSSRKRRGEELATTSKRRARVPIPTRAQKPPKPRVPAAPPKASQWSDSEDSDAGSNSPPKLRHTTVARSPSYAFRVNEGAGTSKQPDRPRRVLGVRRTSQMTDAGRANTSSPRSIASSDGPTRKKNLDSGVERTREQQLRAESLAVINRAARAERMADTAAARGMQRRQAIAARQQQLAEGSPLSRRNATNRVTHTVTCASVTPRVPETKLTALPQLPEPEPDPEPGPSNLRRKRQTSTPSDPGRSSYTRSSSSESEPQKESQQEPELPKLLKKKSTSPDLPTSTHTQLLEKESEPETKAESQPQTVPEPQPGPSKVRRTKSMSSPGDAGNSRSLDLESEPQPGPSKPRTKKTPTLIGGFTHRARHTPERQTVCVEEEEEGSAQFKVPRIPAARKSTERRSKSQGSEQDDTQIAPESATPPKEPDEGEPTNPNKVFTACPKIEKLSFPSRENLAEPIIRPKNACLSKNLTTVRSIVHATETELADRCGHCIYCTRVDKIRKISSFVQNQRKPAATTNEVYDFDADKEDSHENTRLYNFRQNRKAKQIEPPKDPPKDPVYLDVLPAQNSHIIEITSVPMPNQNKPMLRARLIRKTDANLENEFSLIEHENLLDQLLEIKIANSDQTAKKTTAGDTEEAVAGPSNTEPSPEVNESGDDEELMSKNNLSEFLARLQTKLDARRKVDQTSVRPKTEKPVLQKKNQKEVKKSEPVKKTKGPKLNQDETTHVEPPKNSLSDNNLSSCFREAPVFHPTEEEFMDPLAYIEKIYPVASQFGLCKVVAPPGFKPKCTITDDVRFNVANQYISRLYCRWGAASKEMCAIKAYLAEQKVFFTRPPLIEGIELNLPKLYRTVQRHGGLKKVIEKKRWGRVAEDMRFPRGRRSAKRIDQLYVKHLLPYDTLSSAERRELMATVENSWNRNYKKMLSRASNPLHRQKRLMGESESSEEVSDEDANLAYALAEAEDCVVTGRCMKVSVFKKVASNLMCTLFPHSEQPTPKEVEQEYWTLVSGAAEHVCVNAASIDTGEEGYGFPRAKHDPYSKHPWNLKMFSQNDGNVLRSLGPVLGVTVPTLHLGMVFATSCWHRDPHGLPWVEYMHHGPPKIWYGIPDELSAEFRKAVETLCPTSCQNKSIWLPSDITMIPPHLLREANVPLSRTEQSPGEFVLVCPKAYSSSIATGYTESESVYFAPTQWLADVSDVFQELRDSCEPTMFSLAQLLLAVARDSRTPAHALAGVYVNLRDIVYAELSRRDALEQCGVEISAPERKNASCGQARKKPAGAWNVREQDECEVCRTTLYLSKVTGLTSKRSSLCLEHALLLIEKDKKRDVSGVVATIFVLRAELENAVRRVELRLKE